MPLDDGTYDAMVLWAETRDDATIALELTISAGAHKGEVVHVIASATPRAPLELVELPCTLEVDRATPAVKW